MKKLPIGIQSFEKIRKEGYVYVDKTSLIYSLITENSYYFLSRPRRFGKSLLIDTLKNLFLGKKKLFQGLAIDSMEYDWRIYPIIHFDFSLIPHTTPEILKEGLERRLHAIAADYHVSISVPTLQEGLIDLVQKLSKKEKVVVLVDEYDKPLIDPIDKLEIAKENRTILKDFYAVLKGLDLHLRFVFITGVSKFAQVSIFSGMNNLYDITISSHYPALLGYTEKEMTQFFQEHVNTLARKQKQTPRQLIALMRHWYNGYGFSAEKCSVYNPLSTLLFLQEGRTNNYWFKTATPTFLFKEIKKQSYPVDQISGCEVGDSLFDSHDLEKMNFLSLMWQTGYLTIRSYDPTTRLYCLDYPNEEVREAFIAHLAEEMTGLASPQIGGYARACVEALQECNLELFFEKLKTFFASIPYDMNVAEEKYYQTIFFVFAQLIGLEVDVETKTNVGRIDLVITAERYIYLFEFKINSSADLALQQINTKKYFEKYLGQSKKVVLIGANFDTKLRTISEWKSAEPKIPAALALAGRVLRRAFDSYH